MPMSRFMSSGGERLRTRQAGQWKSSRGPRVLCVLAAGLTTIALAVPATAGATSKAKLISEAKLSMRVEKDHIISFAPGAKFVVGCSVTGARILCTEHTGPEACVKSKYWTKLSDLFPIIKGRVGESLAYGLTITDVYCKK
jgi:hypothetical protein